MPQPTALGFARWAVFAFWLPTVEDRMRIVGVIPARMASSRLPGKPLAEIGGEPMVLAVWRRACTVLDTVILAVDGPELEAVGRAAGATVVRTDPALPSGSDRVAAAVEASGIRADAIVNIQGDQPFLDPEHLRALCASAAVAPVVTLAAPLDDPQDPARVKLVTDRTGRALYFSRAPIPWGGPYRQHIGLYLFHRPALAAFVSAPPSPLERAESLEQLRLFELGLPIHVVDVAQPSLSVDTPADLAEARRQAAARG